jgi:hypothetical protein
VAGRVSRDENKQDETKSREKTMERADDLRMGDRTTRGDMAKLIRKLRWIGLEDEARRLQRVASTLPPEEAGCVSAGPFPTD